MSGKRLGKTYTNKTNNSSDYSGYVGQETIVRTRHGTTDWFKIGNGVHQDCILLPCLFNFYAEYIMQDTGWMKSQAGIQIAERAASDVQMIPL